MWLPPTSQGPDSVVDAESMRHGTPLLRFTSDAGEVYTWKGFSTRRYDFVSITALVGSRDLVRRDCRMVVWSRTKLATLRQVPSGIAEMAADIAELTSRADVILNLTWSGRSDGPNIYSITPECMELDHI
ncbi:hypothetical protein BHM03_00019982 [Ensete ventricosum]|nr:hypothetical protein BHM03_00019982 [Ensete ventricosum]